MTADERLKGTFGELLFTQIMLLAKIDELEKERQEDQAEIASLHKTIEGLMDKVSELTTNLLQKSNVMVSVNRQREDDNGTRCPNNG